MVLITVLSGVMVYSTGCALLLVGTAAGAGVSYIGNELRATKDVTVDQACQEAEEALPPC